jgi:AraC-like DNA-binding protein
LEHVSIIGVHFWPGGAFPFFKLPVSELADRHVELDALWGESASELRERLCAARTSARRFRLLENALTSRLYSRTENHYAVRFALKAFASAESEQTIARVTQKIGLSQRRLIQVFKEEVGMSPKLFCRVRRFQNVLASVREEAAPDWARVAVDFGYFDQSHFINDFRFFCGLTPTEYVRQWSSSVLPNHVPLTAWTKRSTNAHPVS